MTRQKDGGQARLRYGYVLTNFRLRPVRTSADKSAGKLMTNDAFFYR